MIWAYQNVVGMPRVAAIEHPFGRPYGDVGDAETQRVVVRAALAVSRRATEPGHVEHLPFRWHQEPSETKWHPPEPSPIIALMKARQARLPIIVVSADNDAGTRRWAESSGAEPFLIMTIWALPLAKEPTPGDRWRRWCSRWNGRFPEAHLSSSI